MGNSESISNDLENFGNQIVNGVVDTGHQIADGGSTAINETTNIINQLYQKRQKLLIYWLYSHDIHHFLIQIY